MTEFPYERANHAEFSKVWYLLPMTVNALPPVLPIRLGHAFPNPPASEMDWIQWAIAFLDGKTELDARAATNSAVVARAEGWLGIAPDQRPVYSYAGCLHPALGRIGLVLSTGWLTRGLQGGSRCDSGGLAGGLGGFACIGPHHAECKAALLDLSFAGTHNWRDDLHTEVSAAYGAEVQAYVRGDEPVLASLDDHRRRFVQYAHAKGITDKRRLWTWEFRATSPAKNTDVYAIALAHEAFKLFDELRRDSGLDFPDLRVISGSVGPSAVHHFQELEVVEALSGAP